MHQARSLKLTMEALLVAEQSQHENLFALLGTVNGSKPSSNDKHLPSIARGLCTSNQKLLNLLNSYLSGWGPDGDVESFKSFVNDFILWLDKNFIIFEKYLSCLAVARCAEASSYQGPIKHCSNYITFAEEATVVLRNPFVVDKLTEFCSRIRSLLEENDILVQSSKLKNINFSNVRNVGGMNVSCYFNVDQIVKRTHETPMFMGETSVELVLLNLGQSAKFDAFAVLEVSDSQDPRNVLYPPFRVNDLSMSFAHNCITFDSFPLGDSLKKHYFVITGHEKTIIEWFEELKSIFPTSSKPVATKSIQSQGLGIQTILDSEVDNPCDSTVISRESGTPEMESIAIREDSCSPEMEHTSPSKTSRSSMDSCHSRNIMKKTLSNHGIETEDKESHLQVVRAASDQHHSISAEYAYEDGSHIESSSGSDNVGCFDIVTSKNTESAIQSNQGATVSLPNLSATIPEKTIYTNKIGSAIDVNNFGKNHNPSFVDIGKPESKKAKRISFFNLFKKRNKSMDNANPEKSSNRQKGSDSAVTKSKSHLEYPCDTFSQFKKVPALDDPSDLPKVKEAGTTNAKIEAKPHSQADLRIEIPKINPDDPTLSQPGSASSLSNRTLPSPFALPSSTSTYFFKPYLHGNGSETASNGSTSSLLLQEKEQSLDIPQDFKDIVNSDDSIDFYISPTSRAMLKVSKWKPKYGKWELLTSNEDVFMKIVANYNLHKSWLMVFKEEYDECYDEVIDKPLLVLNLDANTNTRQSTALDIEINCINTFTKQKNLILVRSVNSALVQEISSNITNILEVMATKKSVAHSSNFESSATLTSSLMSKPSTSSTLTSIYTNADVRQTPVSSVHKSFDNEADEFIQNGGIKLLLDRLTVKLHRQMEGYEHIQQASSWKPLAMYSLSISHSVEAEQEGFYHFEMVVKQDAVNEDIDTISWSFRDKEIHEKIEQIGKAALLVKVSKKDIYMLECKGKKAFKRLVNLF